MKLGNGIKDRDDRSSGREILMADPFIKINPTDPLRLTKQVARSKFIGQGRCFTMSMQFIYIRGKERVEENIYRCGLTVSV